MSKLDKKALYKRIEEDLFRVRRQVPMSEKTGEEVGKERFCEKYARLPASVEEFTTRDLVYYFQKKAEEAGVEYFITSWGRDTGIVKNLLKHFDNATICLMIEFIFSGDQRYINISGVSIGILSVLSNRIYYDARAWAQGTYQERVPVKREYKSGGKKPTVGDWDV